MSTHFSANQYEQAFDAKRLQNWEVPQRFKERPSTLEGFTQIISNDRGHLIEGIPRSAKSAWGDFIGTWDMRKVPLRTKTLKTKVMAEKSQQLAVKSPSPKEVEPAAEMPSPRNASPKQPTPRDGSPMQPTPRNVTPEKLRTQPPQCATPVRSPAASPTNGVSPRRTPDRPMALVRQSPVQDRQ